MRAVNDRELLFQTLCFHTMPIELAVSGKNAKPQWRFVFEVLKNQLPYFGRGAQTKNIANVGKTKHLNIAMLEWVLANKTYRVVGAVLRG